MIFELTLIDIIYLFIFSKFVLIIDKIFFKSLILLGVIFAIWLIEFYFINSSIYVIKFIKNNFT